MTRFASKPGFTLAELLIALALLGIIAAFTIPKVLQSSAEQEKIAKLRETVSILEQIAYDVRGTNQLTPLTSLYDYATPRLNTIVAKSAGETQDMGEIYDGIAHPCIAVPPNHWLGFGWIQLQNGVVISGIDNYKYGVVPQGGGMVTGICIDLNGRKPPNIPGEDVFIGNFHLWGDYDGPGQGQTFGPDRKMFNWGSATQEVYSDSPPTPPGNVLQAPLDTVEARVGYWLAR